MSDDIRAFIAVELPLKIVEAISALQADLKNSGLKIRWVKPSNIHLTLKFLGDIPAEKIPVIEQALSAAVSSHAPLTLSAKGIGVFPGIKKPRVIWVGVSGQIHRLREVQQSVESGLNKVGFAVERRTFKSHLTLGRMKGFIDSDRLLKTMQGFSHFASEAFSADRIHLFRSRLKPSGAVYTKLIDVPLAGSGSMRSELE